MFSASFSAEVGKLNKGRNHIEIYCSSLYDTPLTPENILRRRRMITAL